MEIQPNHDRQRMGSGNPEILNALASQLYLPRKQKE